MHRLTRLQALNRFCNNVLHNQRTSKGHFCSSVIPNVEIKKEEEHKRVKDALISSGVEIANVFDNKDVIIKPSGVDITKIFKDDDGNLVENLSEHLIARAIRNAEWELIAVCEQEIALNHSLDADQLAWRGIALDNLLWDKSYFRHVDSNASIEIKLVVKDNESSLLGSRTFRVGNLVNIVHNQFKGLSNSISDKRSSTPVDWMMLSGIVSFTSETHLLVQISNLSTGFALDAFNRNKPQLAVSVVKRSDTSRGKDDIRSLDQTRRSVNKTILKFLVGRDPYVTPETVRKQQVVVFRKDLDKSKLDALELSAEKHPLTIIHGPPGTGKTTALAAIILSAVANGDRVLAAAPSHAAVDSLAKSVLSQWPTDVWGDPVGKVVRIGSELRLTIPEMARFLPQKLENGLQEAVKVNSELKKVRKELLIQQRDQKGHLMKKELELRKEVVSILRDQEEKIIGDAKIVICTNSVAHMYTKIRKDIETGNYSLVCIDEAAFANDASILPILLRTERIILSGDHCQLPPIVLSDKAKSDGHDVSLMERLVKRHPDRVALLSTQYRSNQLISGWSSNMFYDGKLEADASVARSQLSDLRGVTPCPDTRINLLFIDTKDSGFKDNSQGGDSFEESFANFDEAFLVEQLVRKYIALGVKPSSIGVITPYWAQVTLLRSLLWDGPNDLQRVAIHTVDGFQGREKELIIISFVRSNEPKKVGFLSETRRINVSVTRAKRCCIAVGDSSTLESDQGLKSFIQYCQHKKAIVSVNNVV